MPSKLNVPILCLTWVVGKGFWCSSLQVLPKRGQVPRDLGHRFRVGMVETILNRAQGLEVLFPSVTLTSLVRYLPCNTDKCLPYLLLRLM